MRGIDDKYLLECALASERDYFSLASEIIHEESFLFAAVPGFKNLPAASVAIVDTEHLSLNTFTRAIEKCEERFARAGSRIARFYVGEIDRDLSIHLEAKLYRRRTEIIHAIAPLPAVQDNMKDNCWRKVRSEQDWAEKADLYAAPSATSDGYASNHGEWLSLERLKAETGKIDFWLHSLKGTDEAAFNDQPDGRAVATTGTMQCADHVTRIKNIYMRPRWRGKGVGKLALRSLLHLVKKDGAHAAIMLSIEGSVGERLYRSVGAKEIGRIYEWSRKLR